MSKIHRLCFAAMLVVLLLSGCGQEIQTSTEGNPPRQTVAGEMNGNTTDATPVIKMLEAAAITDLSERLAVATSEIEFVRIKNVTWRDGSLGCPKEGMMYTQALVDGTVIILRFDNKNYHYHAAQGRDPFYCENPVKPAPKSSLD